MFYSTGKIGLNFAPQLLDVNKNATRNPEHVCLYNYEKFHIISQKPVLKRKITAGLLSNLTSEGRS